MNYDLIIPCHPKDYFKLKYCISSCVQFLNPKPQNIYIVSPNELFDEDKPKFFISDREQCHQPYFNFMKISHDLDRQVDHTFINDFMMFNKSVCHEIIGNDLSILAPLLAFCNKNLSDDCLLSEFELYGNYVSKHHPDLYTKQNTKTKMFGRHENQPWHEDEIDQYVQHMKDTDYDLFTMHTWT